MSSATWKRVRVEVYEDHRERIVRRVLLTVRGKSVEMSPTEAEQLAAWLIESAQPEVSNP